MAEELPDDHIDDAEERRIRFLKRRDIKAIDDIPTLVAYEEHCAIGCIRLETNLQFPLPDAPEGNFARTRTALVHLRIVRHLIAGRLKQLRSKPKSAPVVALQTVEAA